MSEDERSTTSIISIVKGRQDAEEFKKLHWTGTFAEYMDMLTKSPSLSKSAFRRVYDMILSYGYETYKDGKDDVTKYRFFSDPEVAGEDTIYGLDRYLMQLVQLFRSGAMRYGIEKRVLLLHGPVGSSKSTIVRRIKRGLEAYTRTDDGALYTYEWNHPDEVYPCPMHEDPLHLIPEGSREGVETLLNEGRSRDDAIIITGRLCPLCQYAYGDLARRYDGDWERIVGHVVVKRMAMSEHDRVGIGTFQPKDEKNQDSTELTGDINYRKIAQYGSDSDARCLSADTLVSTGDGIMPLGDIAASPGEDAFTPGGPVVHSCMGAAASNSTYSGGSKATYTIFTRLGYEICATANHRFLTLNPGGEMIWKSVRDIDESDFLALYRSSLVWPSTYPVLSDAKHTPYGNERNIPTIPTVMSEDLAEWIGMWIGDGFMTVSVSTHQYEIGWVKGKEQKINKYTELFHRLFDLRPNRKRRKNVYHVRLGCRKLATWLIESIGLARGARNKAIPDVILRSPKSCVVACLKGMWMTDGSIMSRDGANFASYSTSSGVLAKQVQTLLLALGVVSCRKKTRDQWCVEVYGKNVIRLVDLIPELNGDFLVGQLDARRRNIERVDLIPHVKPLLREMYKLSDNRERLKRKYSGNLHDRKKPHLSIRTIKEFLAAAELSDDRALACKEKVESVINRNLLWLSVSGVEAGDRKLVYDISVPETHSYWANGFVVHNCFDFTGEFNVANRGIFEIIEFLKLDRAFLYDLLGASQEHTIKPKKFPQIDIDEVILTHSNNPEYRKLQNDEFMEALRDRTVKVDVPYVTRLSDEIKIYEKDFNPAKVRKHIAPHTIEMAAMWAVLTRLEDPKEAKLTLLQKLKLYNGKVLPGFTEESVKELRAEAKWEGMEGISPRYIQDKISNALVKDYAETGINPFMVLNELEAGLDHHSLITSEEQKKRYRALLSTVKEEYEDIVKNEVQRAIAADDGALAKLCANYIDNIRAYTQKEKVKNKFTGKDEEPDERLMRSIEEKIEIPETRKDDFRSHIMNYIGALAIQGKMFDYKSNERLLKALELKLFEDQKDSIKLTSLVSNVVDKETQEKIDVVKTRLVRDFGYSEESATDVLQFVASIFARGDVKDKGKTS